MVISAFGEDRCTNVPNASSISTLVGIVCSANSANATTVQKQCLLTECAQTAIKLPGRVKYPWVPGHTNCQSQTSSPRTTATSIEKPALITNFIKTRATETLCTQWSIICQTTGSPRSEAGFAISACTFAVNNARQSNTRKKYARTAIKQRGLGRIRSAPNVGRYWEAGGASSASSICVISVWMLMGGRQKCRSTPRGLRETPRPTVV